jgi:quercetin dioxygenase-like cupin family protein
MSTKPIVVREDDREWEAWSTDQAAERGDVSWKTLVSADLTQSSALTLGVACVSQGQSLRAHRHEQAEAYFVLQGSGVVTVDGSPRTVGPGTAVFLPGGAIHSIECSGETDLRFAYVFAADSFGDVAYVFCD